MSEIAERILVACDKVTAKGYRVEAGAWGAGWNPKRERWAPLKRCNRRLCPLGALTLVEQPPPGKYRTLPAAAAALLGVDISWIADFQGAFDGVFDCGTEGAAVAKEVSRSLAERLAQEASSPAAAKGAAEP